MRRLPLWYSGKCPGDFPVNPRRQTEEYVKTAESWMFFSKKATVFPILIQDIPFVSRPLMKVFLHHPVSYTKMNVRMTKRMNFLQYVYTIYSYH